MKKTGFLFIILCLIAVSSLNAQIVAGGNLDLGLIGKPNSSMATNFNISAKAAYVIVPEFRAGLEFGYGYNTSPIAKLINNSQRFQVYPFIQYLIFDKGKFKVFAEARVGIEKVIDDETSLGYRVMPVLAYEISRNLRITAALNLIKIEGDYGLNSNSYKFNFGAGNKIGSLGMCYVIRFKD